MNTGREKIVAQQQDTSRSQPFGDKEAQSQIVTINWRCSAKYTNTIQGLDGPNNIRGNGGKKAARLEDSARQHHAWGLFCQHLHGQ